VVQGSSIGQKKKKRYLRGENSIAKGFPGKLPRTFIGWVEKRTGKRPTWGSWSKVFDVKEPYPLSPELYEGWLVASFLRRYSGKGAVEKEKKMGGSHWGNHSVIRNPGSGDLLVRKEKREAFPTAQKKNKLQGKKLLFSDVYFY